MTAIQIVEVLIALGLLVWGVILYRRGGSQGAVIVLVIGALVLIHGLGLMDYRPSPAELQQ